MSRHSVLKDNESRRRGNGNAPRQLDEGAVTFKIPAEDYDILRRTHPDLFSHCHVTRLKAWHAFRNTPLGETYMVVRTPNQVKRAHKNRIIVR